MELDFNYYHIINNFYKANLMKFNLDDLLVFTDYDGTKIIGMVRISYGYDNEIYVVLQKGVTYISCVSFPSWESLNKDGFFIKNYYRTYDKRTKHIKVVNTKYEERRIIKDSSGYNTDKSISILNTRFQKFNLNDHYDLNIETENYKKFSDSTLLTLYNLYETILIVNTDKVIQLKVELIKRNLL